MEPSKRCRKQGSLLIDPEVIGPVMTVLPKEEAFFIEENRIVFNVLRDLFERNKPIDAMVLHTTLKAKNLLQIVGGIEYIKNLANAVPTSAHAEFYAVQVRELWRRRTLISASAAILQDCYNTDDDSDSLIDRVEARIYDATKDTIVVGSDTAISDCLHDAFEAMDRRSGEGPRGVQTGLVELDRLTDGFHAQEMIVIAARPSVGKTAFAMGIAEYVGVDLKKPVAVFSLEMSKQQLAQRMLSSRSGVNAHTLRTGLISKHDRDRMAFAVGELADGKIYINDKSSMTITELRTSARRMKQRYGIELLILDYLQLMEAGGRRGENRQQEITSISRGIKALARELNIPVVCLSQLNRASETENRLPRTSDLRESGAIEQDADVVMLLHREAMLHRGDADWMAGHAAEVNEALVIVGKQRNGPCDIVKLTFLAGTMRFTSYSPGV
ncbi:MAG TPA: replicative DNA helicase [Phycisphaerae bacterium]|nr:replicative DNA helicase [Phycisphaerae bacterium]